MLEEEITNMEFDTDDLLNKKEIELLIESDLPHKKAKLIATKLIKYSLVHNNSMYILQSNLTYVWHGSDVKASLTNLTTQLIETSFENLSKEDVYYIQKLYSTKANHYSKIFSNCNVEKYLPQLKEKMTKSNAVFDVTMRQIHYNNGYIDLDDGLLYPRVFGTHFITKYINRDYVKSTAKQQKFVLSVLKKIYPKKEDMDCIMLIIGSALSGESCRDQDTLFLLGKGSSAKSFVMTLTKLAIECYFKELSSNTFSQNNKNVNKTLNTYVSNPQVRISWMNEIEDTKMNSELFKKFCEGFLTTTMLYTEGSHDVTHYSKLITTANTLPIFQVDTGMLRRYVGYTHSSSFVDSETDVDISKHVYLKDKTLLRQLQEKKLLDAWVDILAEKCRSWLDGETPEYTENFKENKDTVINSNDFIQDFLDANVVITNNETDRVGKNAMHRLFKEMYPGKFLTVQQLIGDLKDKKITYNPKFRCEKVQGCYVGIRLRHAGDDYEEEDGDDTEVDTEADNSTQLKLAQEMYRDFKDLYEKSDKTNEILLKRVRVLEKQLKIKHPFNEDYEDEDFDDEVDESRIDFYPYDLPPGVTININLSGEKKQPTEKFEESVSELDDDDFDEINVHLQKH